MERSIQPNSLCIRIPKDSILECNLPCILHWNQNHFVVLYKIESKQKKYYICNPSKGLSIVNDDEFTVSWLSKSGVGIALLLEPTEKFGLQKEVMTTNRHSLSFILKYLKEYRKYLFSEFSYTFHTAPATFQRVLYVPLSSFPHYTVFYYDE